METIVQLKKPLKDRAKNVSFKPTIFFVVYLNGIFCLECKYAKGEWTECLDGSRERTDILRTEVSSTDCKPSRQITKPCKKRKFLPH